MKKGWKKWNPVNSYYKDKYLITRKGQIKSLKTNKILKPLESNRGTGYYQIYLYSGSLKTRKRFYIHRLVAKTFVTNPKNKPCINHKDGNGRNNHYKNLEWCTYKENAIHSHKTGLQIALNRDTGHKGAKITTKDINQIRKVYKGRGNGPTQIEVGKMFNVSWKTINAVVNHKSCYKK